MIKKVEAYIQAEAKKGRIHSAAEIASAIKAKVRDVSLVLGRLSKDRRITKVAEKQGGANHWAPVKKNPSPGVEKFGDHATATQRIAAAAAERKARAFFGHPDLETRAKKLKGYKAPLAFVDIGNVVALEYDSDKFDGIERIYRHEAEKKRKFLISVDGSTIIVHPPFKITKRGIEG